MDSRSSCCAHGAPPVVVSCCQLFRLSESLGRGKSPMPMNSELAVEGFLVFKDFFGPLQLKP